MIRKIAEDRIKLVIFDLDGVIIDSEPIHMQVTNSILENLGTPLTWAEYEVFIGGSDRKIWTSMKERFNLDMPIKTLIDNYHVELIKYFKQANKIPPVEGIPELLDVLDQEKIAYAIGSSSSHMNICMALEATGLSKRIMTRISGEDVTHGKPAPDIFLLAAKRMGFKPEECLVIEDSEAGVKAAVSAGMACVGLINASSGKQNLTKANYLVHSLKELVEE